MKVFNHRYPALVSIALMLIMSACEHNVSTVSSVYPDGSLDRSVVLHNADSASIVKNIFGVGEAKGWNVILDPPSKPATEKDKKSEVNITFKKHFESVDDVNRDMHSDLDTVVRIASSFEKQNRWFYSYIEYRDTYRALNNFNVIPKEEYFTQEDFGFIERLPAEGTPISHADSLYLSRLNEKIFDFFGARTIFEDFYQHLVATMHQHNVPLQWQDSLSRKKENVYRSFVDEGNLHNEDFAALIDRLRIPLPPAAREAIAQKTAEIEKRLEFLSDAYSGQYVHTIEMPWDVVESNADSVIGNKLFWRPPVVKFLLADYTMSATSRKMNIWSVALSGFVVCVTVGMYFVRRR